jgi:integrase/recombinase XerD
MRRDTRRGLGLDWYYTWQQGKRIAPLLARSLLAPHWDGLATWLFGQRYTWYTVRRVITIAKAFASFSKRQGTRDAGGLTEERAQLYEGRCGLREARRCLKLLARFLRSRGILDPVPSAPSKPPRPALLDEYVRFLADHRGLGPSVSRHEHHVAAFLKSLKSPVTLSAIRRLEAAHVFRFIRSRSQALGPAERKAMCAAVRAFMRFLHLRGYLARDLAPAVPVIPTFKLDRLPKAIPWEDVEKILAAVDRSTPLGRRDYALLVLLATYGIRNGQILDLRLDDIDWRRETLRVRGAKGGRDVLLPLRRPVGEALVDYLRHGRPTWPSREIFLRVRAPMGPLRGTVGNVIKAYAAKARVTTSRLCPHAWRHAVATRMLAKGQSIKTIRDVLGHRSVETTCIYAKVDVEMLRQAALDWPGEAL